MGGASGSRIRSGIAVTPPTTVTSPCGGGCPNVLAVVWLLIVVASFFAPEVAALAIAGWLVLLAAFGCLIVHEVLRRRITQRALTYLAGVAADARGKNLIREYQRYLMDAA